MAEEIKGIKNIFSGRKVLVVGLARSGTAAASLLSVLGARVSVTDRKPLSTLTAQMDMLPSAVKFLEYDRAGMHLDSHDLIVVSPGVPAGSPLMIQAALKGVPVIGELELAWQVAVSYSPPPLFIGITGTNGKSTTSTLVHGMLKQAGFQTILGGNIGNALTGELLNAVTGEHTDEDDAPRGTNARCIVAEISSFQLETIQSFRPGIAVLLNITPDHLDRYSSMDEYIKAKARIVENQTPEDWLIVNADDPAIRDILAAMRKERAHMPRVLYFSREKEVDGVYFSTDRVIVNLSSPALREALMPSGPTQRELIGAGEIRIRGDHNLENAMAASLAAMASGCPLSAITDTLKTFPGLEHRLEYAGQYRGVTFINDSKGTNVGAVAKSLSGFGRIILIMGGQDKGSDFSVLRGLIEKHVKLLILIGQAANAIHKALGDIRETHMADSLRDAVALSVRKAAPGDTVMLSPGCASFDMFADFEDRGRQFKKAVKEIAGEQ